MGFTCNPHQPTMSGSEVSTGNAPVPENAEKICEEKELESLTSGAVLGWLCSVCILLYCWVKVWLKLIPLKQRISVQNIVAP